MSRRDRNTRLLRRGYRINVQQNTDKWLKLRRNAVLPELKAVSPRTWRRPKDRSDRVFGLRIGASEAADACGLGYNAEAWMLFEKITRFERDPDYQYDAGPAAEHGHRNEEYARKFYERITGLHVDDGGYWIPRDETDQFAYGASPDGLVIVSGMHAWNLEIKCPYHAMYKDVPTYYVVQMFVQMACTGVPMCDFLAVKYDRSNVDERNPVDRELPVLDWMLKRVYWNDATWAWIHERIMGLYYFMVADILPPKGRSNASDMPRVEIKDLKQTLRINMPN